MSVAGELTKQQAMQLHLTLNRLVTHSWLHCQHSGHDSDMRMLAHGILSFGI